MAIIINNKNLYRRVINGQDVQRAILNWKEIRPIGWNIDYHVVSNWGTSWGWTWVPWWWDTSWNTIIDENYVSNGGSWNPSKLIYNWMPSLLNAFKVEIIYKLYRTQESAEKPFSSWLTHRTSNTYLSEITQSSWWTRSFLAWNESDNDVLTWATAWEYTITTTLDLENSEATQTIAWPNGFEQELELTLDVTDIYNIRHSDAFWIELNDGMRLYRVDFFVYNTPQNPQIWPWIYHNATLWLISLSLDWENWITIADKDLWATEVYGQWLLYQRGNNHWFSINEVITTSSTKVDASTYWPWNYYNSSVFITSGSGIGNWETSRNTNLWGWDDDTDISKKWPCPEWYHIATATEFTALENIVTWLVWSDSAEDCHQYFLTNNFYILNHSCREESAWKENMWNQYYIWTWLSSYTTNYPRCALILSTPRVRYNGSCSWLPIRPFKNTYVAPDSTRTVLFQPSD